MATGNVENWTGTISDIGPMYPFVGSEWLLWIIGMAVWIVWHFVQSQQERRYYDEEVRRLGNKASLKKIIRGEDPDD